MLRRSLFMGLGFGGLLMGLGAIVCADDGAGSLANSFSTEGGISAADLTTEVTSEINNGILGVQVVSNTQNLVVSGSSAPDQSPMNLVTSDFNSVAIVHVLADSLGANDLQSALTQNIQSASACGVTPAAQTSGALLVIDEDQQSWNITVFNHFGDDPSVLAQFNLVETTTGTQVAGATDPSAGGVFSGQILDFEDNYPSTQQLHDALLSAINNNTSALQAMCGQYQSLQGTGVSSGAAPSSGDSSDDSGTAATSAPLADVSADQAQTPAESSRSAALPAAGPVKACIPLSSRVAAVKRALSAQRVEFLANVSTAANSTDATSNSKTTPNLMTRLKTGALELARIILAPIEAFFHPVSTTKSVSHAAKTKIEKASKRKHRQPEASKASVSSN